MIEGSFCIGCGARAVVDPCIRIGIIRYGGLAAVLPLDITDSATHVASIVCMLTAGEDETLVAERVFPDRDLRRHPQVVRYRSLRAAFAPETQGGCSSGGLVSWLLSDLLEHELNDAVIHVGLLPTRTTAASSATALAAQARSRVA